MSLLTDILVWSSANLLPWQRDALRRLFQHQECSSQDIDDLYAMLKSARGLPDPQNRQPSPLAAEHLPVQSAGAGVVVLHALRELKNVNRIADGEKLTFGPKGITVVYGGNGSGKSGYSRVLKRACRARDVSETVHADASDPQSSGKVPEAIFDVTVGAVQRSLNWKRNSPAPEELSTIAVFDGRCAREYLDEQDVAYLPYGLDIVENLGQKVLPELLRRLNSEIESTNTDVAPFADLIGDTSVGKVIATLSDTTNSELVKKLATLTKSETDRLNELEKTLAENDPKTKAKGLLLSAQRINGLISRIDSSLSDVDEAATQKLKSCDTETEAAIKAEVLAAENLRAGEPLLPGTGDLTWKTLFEAARSFSVESAYPSEAFPHVCSGAKCLLCQQPLNQDAASRMQRFDEFLKQETAKVATEKRQQRALADQKLAKASLAFGLEDALIEELKQLDPAVLQRVQDFEKEVEKRRTWLRGSLNTHDWDSPSPLDCDPRPRLKEISKTLLDQARDLEKASDEGHRKALETERAELRARFNLSLRSEAVQDLVRRMKVKAALIKCKDDLKTKAISDKAKEFASQAVTAALKTALDKEFEALGVGHIKTKLIERVEKGKMKHKLVLALPVTTKLDEILSEGEQRAIAIGSFLAELQLAGLSGGIVFDDPVSSLDHHRRMRVARRLVEEAKQRQVIVLTHETVFLCELLDAIEQQNIDCQMHHLEWANDHPGHVIEGLPWEHMDYKDRLNKLEGEQRQLEASWPAYSNEEERSRMRRQYSRLRATIERIIQDVVFNGVLHRYRDRISIDRLKQVVGFTEFEFKEIERLHKVCCEVIDSHDASSVKNQPVPTAEQLGQDIRDVRSLAKAVKGRGKKAPVSSAGASS
ncbi:MAG: AAA family ATPase [Nitrospira sp.]|nr:AAA family ATPase [Nitrospira sp.]